MSKYGLGIVVLNYKNYNLTSRVVNDIISKGIQAYIAIVDNNSPNESFDVLNEMFCKTENVSVIKSNHNGGYAYGNNVGIKAMLDKDIEYIAIMNPDVILSYNFSFDRIIGKIDNRNDIAGVTPVQLHNGTYNQKSCGWKLPSAFDVFKLNLFFISKIKNPTEYKYLNIDEKDKSLAEIDVMPGSFFIIKRSVFEEVGLFDEKTFLYYEENILSRKIERLGLKNVLSIDDYYIHDHQEKEDSFKSLETKFKDYKHIINSQKQYVTGYLENGKSKWNVVAMAAYFHLYVEMPITHLIKKIIRIVK